MQKIAIYFTAVILFTGLFSCNKLDDDMDELSLHQDQNTTESVVAKSGSGIDYTPDATWSGVYSSGSKIRVFRKGTANTYVIAVDLEAGGQVIPYYEFSSGGPSSSNPSPVFNRKLVQNFNMSSLGWFAVANFGFFDMDLNTSAFLLKKNSSLVTSGYGTYDEYEPTRRTVAINTSTKNATVFNGPGNNSNNNIHTPTGRINLYNATNSAYSSFNHVMTGLHPSPSIAPKTPNGSIGRTFVGVKQKNPMSGGPSIVYILVASSLKQQQAYDILTAFQCASSDIVMFDGSHSSQLNVGGNILVPSSGPRTVPTFLAIK